MPLLRVMLAAVEVLENVRVAASPKEEALPAVRNAPVLTVMLPVPNEPVVPVASVPASMTVPPL